MIEPSFKGIMNLFDHTKLELYDTTDKKGTREWAARQQKLPTTAKVASDITVPELTTLKAF